MAFNHSRLALGVIITSIFALVFILLLYFSNKSQETFDYGLTLDIGSTSTKVDLYHWPSNKLTNGLVRQVGECKAQDGFSHNVNNSKVINQIMDCVLKVAEAIPKKKKGPFTVFAGATAGIRILRLKDGLMSELILRNISNAFQTRKFLDHSFRIGIIKIISGEEEGFSAWITANYLSNLIPSNTFCSYPEMPKGSLGILDMGGASTQIAYATKKYANNLLQIFNQVYSTRSESSLCFGSDQAVKRHLFNLILNQSSEEAESLLIKDPCTSNGPDQSIQSDYFLDEPCLQTVYSHNIKRNVTYTFKADTVNYKKCPQVVSNLVNSEVCSKRFINCFIFQGEISNDTIFYAFASYYYMTRYLNTFKDTGVTKIESSSYLNETETWCQKSWIEKLAIQKNTFYVRNLCFKLHFIYSILNDGYKLKDWSKINFLQSVNGQSLGWSLGFILHESMFLPSNWSSAFISLPTLIVSLFILISLIIFGCYILYKNTFKSLLFHTKDLNGQSNYPLGLFIVSNDNLPSNSAQPEAKQNAANNVTLNIDPFL